MTRLFGFPNFAVERMAASGTVLPIRALAGRRHRSPQCYAIMHSWLAIPAFIASVVAFCGCGSELHRQTPDYALKLTLYQTNQAPLATLQLVLPRDTSTNWSGGQWRGALVPAYVRPQTDHLLASDLLKQPSWQTLWCRTDAEEPGYIRILLRPSVWEDQILLWIPTGGGSPSECYWKHRTEAGTCDWGTLKIVSE